MRFLNVLYTKINISLELGTMNCVNHFSFHVFLAKNATMSYFITVVLDFYVIRLIKLVGFEFVSLYAS